MNVVWAYVNNNMSTFFINCNKCTILILDVNRGNWVQEIREIGETGIWDLSVPYLKQ